MPDKSSIQGGPRPARKQHVVAHQCTAPDGRTAESVYVPIYDEVLVFGQEIDALRHILGKTGWVYAAVQHGQPFTEALGSAATTVVDGR